MLSQGDVEIDLEEARGPVKEWVAQEPVRREIKRRFSRFLRTWQDDAGEVVYRHRIRDMVRSECGFCDWCLDEGRWVGGCREVMRERRGRRG